MATFIHSKSARLYLDGYDLSGDTTALEGLPGERKMQEVSTLADLGTKHLAGLDDVKVTAEMIFDSDTAGEDVIIAAMRTGTANKVLTFWPRGAVAGYFGYGGNVILRAAPVPSKINDVVRVRPEFLLQNAAQKLTSIRDLAAVTATTSSASIDGAASSAAGGSWYFHITVISASGGNAQWNVKLEDSANDSSFATVGTETYNVTAASGVQGARYDFTGTLRRYVRVTVTLDASSGGLTFQASFIRN